MGQAGPSTVPAAFDTTASLSDVGKCIVATGAITIPASTFIQGDAFTIYNATSSSITITQGSGVTLRLAGTTTTGNRTLAAYGLASLWCNSASEIVSAGAGLN